MCVALVRVFVNGIVRFEGVCVGQVGRWGALHCMAQAMPRLMKKPAAAAAGLPSPPSKPQGKRTGWALDPDALVRVFKKTLAREDRMGSQNMPPFRFTEKSNNI